MSHQVDRSSKALVTAILKAAKESIPRGSRRDYKPYWSEELEVLHEEVTTARKSRNSTFSGK